MAQPPIGIDLGTSTSEIAFFENGRAVCIADPQSPYKSPVVPSIVAVDRRGTLKVGNSALSYVGDPKTCVREAKRLMGTDRKIDLNGQSYRPEEISAQILKHLKAMAEERLGCQVRDVVVSVPANFDAAARTSTRVAAEIAGLNVLRLINEPTAAALAFGIENIDLEAQVLVFDFGGGTLDVTILEMMEGVLDVKAAFGDTELGGKDFDSILMQWLTDELHAQYPGAKLSDKAPAMFKKAAEEIKISLSRDMTTSINVPFLASKSGEPVDLEVELSPSKFTQMVSPLLARARACVHTALDAAKVRPEQIDRILLVGGTTYIPAVRELVAEVFGRVPKAEVPPDLAVAMGAAIHAASAAGKLSQKNDIILSDCCPMGLGIDVVSEVGGRIALVYDSLITLNQKIPYMVQRQYSLLSPDQREVRFRLYQDRTGKAVFPEEAVATGIEGMIVDIPPALYGDPHPLVVEFSYDINGEVRVRASIPGLNRDCNVAFNSSALRMSTEEIESARSRLGAASSPPPELWRSHPRASDCAPLIEKADRHLAQIPPQERSPLTEIVSRLKDALATGSETRIAEARDELIQALFGLDEE